MKFLESNKSHGHFNLKYASYFTSDRFHDSVTYASARAAAPAEISKISAVTVACLALL